MRRVEVVGPSSGKADIMRFRNLKKTTPATDPFAVVVLLVSQVPPRIVDPIVELVGAIMGVNPSLEEASLPGKCKRKKPSAGTPKRPQKKAGETSSGAASELWKPEFSAYELNRQVTKADSTKDLDTSVALA